MGGGATLLPLIILLSLLSLVPQVLFLHVVSSYHFQEVRAQEQVVLASEALTHFMKAYLTHYRRQKQELEMGRGGREDTGKKSDGNIKAGLDQGNNEELVEDDDDDEGFLEYFYDIGTSEETVPNVNWTMLKPR